jgi:hypothetical protein
MAGLLVFILKPYRLQFFVAMARPLDFAVPHKKGRPLPLLVDAEEAVVRAATNAARCRLWPLPQTRDYAFDFVASHSTGM